MSLPTWKLPAGVCRGTWDYLQSKSIATDYDAYFVDSPLMRLDLEFIQRFLPDLERTPTDGSRPGPPLVADLGCGTGRVSRLLSPLGYRMLNVDLSQSMLDELHRQCQHPDLNRNVLANLVELDFIEPNSLDLAVCLFSSIGMIRGRMHRQQFLGRVRAALRENAPFILHVHNRYHSLWDPKGPTWLLSTWLRSLFSKHCEPGDRVYAYRGLPSMFLHIYSRRELLQDLRLAGFSDIELHPIHLTGDRLLKNQSFVHWRCGGYFAVARHKSTKK